MSSKLYALVMAGGRGTRFWPESTSKKPKQYLEFVSNNSLLKDSLMRFDGLIDSENRYVVTVEDQVELALHDAEGLINYRGIIREPAGRNTAPCILLAIAHLMSVGAGPDDIVCIVPSDHVILNQQGFRDVIKDAATLSARAQGIVTIGITPTFPQTAYGYIEKGENFDRIGFRVKSFKEKPDFERAKEYLASGNYLWNAGMFVASIRVLMEEFQTHARPIFNHFDALASNINKATQLAEVYARIPKDSIDYAIMEKSNRVYVIPSRFDWNDLGSWDALESVISKTDDNYIVKAENTYLENARNNIVYTPGKMTALVDVNDLIVVANDKVVMVLPKAQAQKVKNIVTNLSERKLFDLI